jgi:hypothetical protein
MDISLAEKLRPNPDSGRISWLRRVRLENPLGHGSFVSGLDELELSGERGGGLGLARINAVTRKRRRKCGSGELCQLVCVPPGLQKKLLGETFLKIILAFLSYRHREGQADRSHWCRR